LTLIALHRLVTTDGSLSELYDYHLVENPALTTAQKHNLQIIFDDLREDTDSYSEEVAQAIFDKIVIREQARTVAQAAIEVINGQSDDLLRLRTSLDSIETDSAANSLVPVTDDLEEIVDGADSVVRWRFNVEELAARAKGGGPGLFAVIAARPEVGKTASWISLSCSPGGFCEQGALVHAIVNEEPGIRTKSRALSACTGMVGSEIKAKNKEAQASYDKIKGKFQVYDAVGGVTLQQVQNHVEKHKPDILVIDQLDKVKLDEDFDSGHERLRAIYTRARELAKANGIFVIGISQLSAEAEGRANPDLSMFEGSKTGKGAECDLAILIGFNPLMQGEWYRQWNLAKNKITGDHGAVTMQLDQKLSRYTE
jgi:replicative DNA helicase